MKIVEIKGRVLKVPRFPYRWHDGFPRVPAESETWVSIGKRNLLASQGLGSTARFLGCE